MFDHFSAKYSNDLTYMLSHILRNGMRKEKKNPKINQSTSN